MRTRSPLLVALRALVAPPLLAATFALAACGDDPQVPSAVAATSGLTSSAAVASLIGTTPEVRITDAKGRGVKDIMVRWRVTAGGGKVVNDSVRTSPNGDATSGGWTLGTVAGPQTLQATADGLPAVTFSSNALPGPATRLQIVTGVAQRAAINTILPVALSVRAEDFFGNPVAGIPVTFSVLQGGGVLIGATQTTNAQGIATLESWKLGTVSGDQLVRVTSGTLQEVSFSAVADPGPLATLVAVSAITQDGATRAPAPNSPTVRTADAFGNAIGSVPVTFATSGTASGTLSSTTVISDPVTGLASTTWTLGTGPQQTVIATTPLLGSVSTTFRATPLNSDFDIDVRFVGDGGTTRQREAFARAVVRWRRALVVDLHNTRVTRPAGDCASWVPAINETINDLVIYARIAPIDGVGRILGQAGPCYINGGSRLTALGVMEFDVDDLAGLIANNTLDAVVLHEVGHVLGIGTLWSFQRSLLVGANVGDPDYDDPYFVGAGARTSFLSNGGMTYGGRPVPVENTGQAGTRGSHWRRSIFGRELMQGFSSPGSSPMSATTIASLTDLGYPGVLLGSADAYTFGLSSFFASPAADLELVNDIAPTPLISIDSGGVQTVVRTKGGR